MIGARSRVDEHLAAGASARRPCWRTIRFKCLQAPLAFCSTSARSRRGPQTPEQPNTCSQDQRQPHRPRRSSRRVSRQIAARSQLSAAAAERRPSSARLPQHGTALGEPSIRGGECGTEAHLAHLGLADRPDSARVAGPTRRPHWRRPVPSQYLLCGTVSITGRRSCSPRWPIRHVERWSVRWAVDRPASASSPGPRR